MGNTLADNLLGLRQPNVSGASQRRLTFNLWLTIYKTQPTGLFYVWFVIDLIQIAPNRSGSIGGANLEDPYVLL